MSRYLVYIAGPVTLGDKMQNLTNAIKAWNMVADHPCLTPVCPHTSILAEMTKSRSHAEWMSLDFPLLKKCDYLLRLPGESKGADQEMEFAREHEIPVYALASIDKLFRDAETQYVADRMKEAGPRKTVIAFMGRPGVGKTTIAKALGLPVVSFADPIKAALKAMGIEKKGTDDTVYRSMAQAIGETARKTDPNFFVKILSKTVSERPEPVFVVDDLRYTNELSVSDYTIFLHRSDVKTNKSADKESEQFCESIHKLIDTDGIGLPPNLMTFALIPNNVGEAVRSLSSHLKASNLWKS